MLEFLSERDEVIHQMLSGMSEEEAEEFKTSLTAGWKRSGTYQLADSHSTISLPEGYRILLGNKAKHERGIFCEAVVYDDAFETTIIFDDFKTGYISLDSWNQIDPAGLLEHFKKNAERAGSECRTIGWLQKPLLDKATNTIYWAIEREGREQGFVHSVALRLYLEGCASIPCIIHIADFVPFDGLLHTMLQSCSFDSNVQYQTYQIGDKIAEGGIAAVITKLFTKPIDLAVDAAEGPGTHQLAQSHSTLSLPEGFKLLKGNLAKKLTGISCEATVYDTFNNAVFFENCNCCYLSLDDWDAIDPIRLMQRIQKNEKKINEEQIKNGGSELSRTLGWLQEPVLNRSTHTIYWAIEIQEDEKRCVNAVALKLYREGCEKITWATSCVTSFVPFKSPLDVMLTLHHFDPGFQYEDYKAGDPAIDVKDVVAIFLGGEAGDQMDNPQWIPEADLKQFARVMEKATGAPRYSAIVPGLLYYASVGVTALFLLGKFLRFVGLLHD